MITLTVVSGTGVVDAGSVVLIDGRDEQNRIQTFAADHRPAHELLAALDELGEVSVEVESWQLWGPPREEVVD